MRGRLCRNHTMRVFVAALGGSDVYLNVSQTPSKLDYVPLGSRDAQLWLGATNQGVRPASKIVYERLQGSTAENGDLWGRLVFPLLHPAWEWSGGTRGDVTHVVLFGTDQGAPHPSDTLYCTQMFKSALRVRYGFKGDVRVHILNCNPSRYDAVHAPVVEALDHIPEADAEVFAEISGGTPALTFSIAATCLLNHRHRTNLLQVTPTPSGTPGTAPTGQVDRVVTWPIRRGPIMTTVARLLERYDYDGTLIFLDSEGFSDAIVRALLQHASARLNLSFEVARATLAPHTTNSGISAILSDMGTDRAPQRLLDYAFAADACYRRQDFAGFLGRAALIRETFGRQAVFAIHRVWIGQTIDATPFDNLTVRNALARENGQSPTVTTFGRILNKSKTGSFKKLAGSAQAIYYKMDPFTRLRNNLWHHGCALSSEIIERDCGGEPHVQLVDISVRMAAILAHMASTGWKPGSAVNPYEAIGALVKNRVAAHAPHELVSP